MTTRQTLDELLARLTEDLTEARLEAASVAVRAERERADRHRAEAAAYMEILEDVRESLELLAPVPACTVPAQSIPAQSIPAQSILDDLEARGLWTVKPDDVPTRDYARDALREVLDGVAAVHARPIDLGVTTGASPVEVSVPVPERAVAKALRGFLVAVDMWEEDMRTRPTMRPTEVIRETYARMREARQKALDALDRADGRDVRGGGDS